MKGRPLSPEEELAKFLSFVVEERSWFYARCRDARKSQFTHVAYIVAWLLDNGKVSVDDTDHQQLQPLHWAVQNDFNLAVVDVLLRHKADIHQRCGQRTNFWRATRQEPRLPLEIAIASRANGCIKRLIDAGCKMEDCGQGLSSPQWVLYESRRRQLRSVACFLLSAQGREAHGLCRNVAQLVARAVWLNRHAI